MSNPESLVILHIDDNESNRYVVARTLNKAGYRVLEAGTGEDGLQQINVEFPDLVILDVQLPDMNGFEVCGRIKSNPATASIPVLHLSASFIGSYNRAQGLDSGADAYLAQPVEPIELLATIRSLLRIRRAEEAALEMSSEWQTTFDSMSEGVGLLDQQGRFRRYNQTLTEILQQPSSQLMGKLYQEVISLPTDDNFSFSQAQTTRQRAHQEAQVGDRWFSITIDPIFDLQEKFTGAVYILTDITARKAAEAERNHLLAQEQEARTQAESANRLKDEFLATLSHELRSPLNAILGWTQLLTSRQLSPEMTAQAIETIGRNARAQAQLVEDLLDVSRIVQGKLRLNMYPLEIKSIINAAIETMRPAADAKTIQLQVVLGAASGLILGDADRIQQIVWNLVSNAIKFTPKGGQVEVRLIQVSSWLEIVISDTGEGIKPEFVPYVFDRFRQADSSSTRSYSGLGLGLAIVRHLVELHGGTVRAYSDGERQGSTFTVQLPLIASKLKADHTEQVNSSLAQTLSFNNSPSLHGIKVLIVDDELDAREYLLAVLKDCKADVIIATSVCEAMALIASQRPDILVSDISMPEEDGYSLIRQVRSLDLDKGGKIPAIALTAYARSEDRIKAIAAGFQLHISKPVEPAELVTVVASLVAKHS